MSVDAELDVWRREWQSRTAVPAAGVRRRVQRQSLIMRITLMAEVLVTAAVGGGATAWAVRSRQPDTILLAGAVWIFLAAAWTFALVSRRNSWSPAALNTSAFLDLSIRRCRSAISATTFGTILYFCELLFCLAWVFRHLSQRQAIRLEVFLSSGAVAGVWLCTAAYLGFVLWYRRKKRAELSYLLALDEHPEQAVPTPHTRIR
jgi:hypothetical protein